MTPTAQFTSESNGTKTSHIQLMKAFQHSY